MNILFLLTPKSQIEFLFESMTLRQAVEKFKNQNFTMVPVIDKDSGKYVRSIRSNDLLNYITQNETDFDSLENIPLSAVSSSREINPININQTIEDVFDSLITQNYVPVIDERGIFIGIITRSKAFSHVMNLRKDK